MKSARVVLGWVGLFMGSTAAGADTALVYVTPQNIHDKGGTFRLTSKSVRNHAVEFVIHRDVDQIDGPAAGAYLSNPEVEPKGLGTPVKVQRDGKIWTWRFSVPADRVAGSEFTLWGGGRLGEGVTYRFRLAEFRKPRD